MSIASSLEKRKLEILKFEVNNMEIYKKTSHCIQCIFVNKPCIISDTGGEKNRTSAFDTVREKASNRRTALFSSQDTLDKYHLKLYNTNIRFEMG